MKNQNKIELLLFLHLQFNFMYFFQNPEDAVNFFDPDTYLHIFELSSIKHNSPLLDDKCTEILSDSD